MADVALLVLAVAGPLVLLVALTLLAIRRRARRVRARADADLGPGIRRTENALGLGLESRGRAQVRGNGWLTLAEDELRFSQWVPPRETRIPLDAITATEAPRWWLGKSIGSRLLAVRWRTPEGGQEAMAWRVADLEWWLDALPPGAGRG